MNLLRSICLLCLCGWTPVYADPIAEQKELYDVRMSQAMNLHADEMAQLAEQYTKALEGSAAMLQKQGNLDGVLAVKAEIQRFKRTGTVPEQSPENTHESVIKMQGIYRGSKAKSDVTKGQSIGELTAKYLTYLEGMQKKLTQEGKFEDAVRVKTEAERARKLQADMPAWKPEARPEPAGNPPSLLATWTRERPKDLGIGMRLNHQGGNGMAQNGRISLTGGRTIIEGLSDKLLEACKKSNAWSLVLHFETAELKQSGPARIFSFSENGHLRNFSLCQENAQLVLRLRTTKTGENGTNPEIKLGGIKIDTLHRLVVTYEPGKLSYYMDGKAIPVQQIGGDFSNWKLYQVVLGNEWKDNRAWNGRIAKFSVYSSALSERDALAQTR